MDTKAPKRRIAWVDYAKGVAIIGVFMMHSAFPVPMTSAISSFDMMLFFFLSGFVFSTRKYPTFWPFLWHRVRTLVIPGLVFAVVGDAIMIVVRLAMGGAAGNLLRRVLGYTVNLRGREGFGQIPWFLTCLFVMEIMAYALVRFAQRRKRPIRVYAFVAVALFLVGYAYSVWIHIVLPWAADVALALFPFFVLGMMLRQGGRSAQDALLRPIVMLPLAVPLGAAVYVEDRVVGIGINPYLNTYGNIVCYAVASVSGVWLVLALCRWIEERRVSSRVTSAVGRVLQYWGRNTLVFYCVNAIIYSTYIPKMLGMIGLDVHSMDVGVQLLCGTLAVGINLVICPLAAELVNRCFPQLLGRSRPVAATV